MENIVNTSLLETHIRSLKLSYRKDMKDTSKFRFENQTLTLEDLSRKIAEKLKYNFTETYVDVSAIELESSISHYVVEKYKKGVEKRASNQLAKKSDLSLKNKIFTIQGIEPTDIFNDEDRRLWSKFYFCEEDKAFYLFDGLKFHYVTGYLPTDFKEIKNFIADYSKFFNKDFYKNFSKAVSEASELSILLHNVLKVQGAESILLMPGFKEIADEVDDEHKTNIELLTEDYFMGLIIKNLFDKKTPSSIWRGYAQLQSKNQEMYDTETEKKILTWNGFYTKTPNNVAVIIDNYISNVLQNYGNILVENINHLKKKPVFVSLKEGSNALNIYDKKWVDTVSHTEKKIEETTLWNYLSTLSEEQRELVSAWCYNTIIPTKLEQINLVLWDLGGTGKTSLLSQTLNTFTKRMYDNEYYYIKGDDFEKPTSRYNPMTNRDMGDSIFCLIDDINTTMLESFANITGSSENTITCKKLYSNEYQKPNNTKYILATNNALSIKRVEAFKRRIAIIHTYANNTWKTTLTSEEFEKAFNEDALTILKYWKSCYDKIINQYNSITNAASQIEEIAHELENATDVEENLNEAVEILLEKIHEQDEQAEEVRISNQDWKTMLEGIISDKSYMRNISIAQVRNKLKQMPNVMINYMFKENDKFFRGIKIKYEVKPKFVEFT